MPEAALPFVWILIGLLLLVGLIGSLVPVIPGTALVLAAAALHAVATGFEPIGPGRLLILFLITVLAYGVDYLAGAFGARRFGGSRWAVFGAVLGAVVGLLFGLVGALLGPVVGAVVGELLRQRHFGQSLRSGVGTALGLLLGALAKFALSLVMVVLFLVWVARG
jgi:uncharacterized protein YqgC (DUF456 family)